MPKAEATGLAPLLIGTSRTLEHLCSGVFDFDGAISGWWSFRAEALGLENAKAAGRILPGARWAFSLRRRCSAASIGYLAGLA
jgi:hypothetical protein